MQRGRAALAQQDLRAASLAARTVLELKPDSIDAARLVAEVAERGSDHTAVEWRARVVQLDPRSTVNRLAWARCALRFNDPATAERALAQIDQAGKQTGDYHAAAALLAQAHRDLAKADEEWAEAVRLAPNEKAYQLQLGVSRMGKRDAKQRAEGEAILESLRHDPAERAAATRALITEGVALHANPQGLVTLAAELQAYPEALFSDRLLYLDLLRQTKDPQFGSSIDELEKRAADKPTELALLLSWMSENKLNLLALDVLKRTPQETTAKWPVPAAAANVYVALKEWHTLEAALTSADWAQLDFLRHAYLALAAEKQDKAGVREREWASALKAASARSDSLMVLLHTVANWRWTNEVVDMLWTLTKYPEKKEEAFATLYQYFSQTNDTQGLFKVLMRLHETDPDNLNITNNLAQVSLLLNAEVTHAREMAADIYHRAPSNAAYATTYAYALLSKGDAHGALQIMNALTEQELHDPPIAAYYGICLAATKDDRALEYVELGRTATLLPEEKQLLDKAEVSLGRSAAN